MVGEQPSVSSEKEDIFWILRSVASEAFRDAELGCLIKVIGSERVDRDEYLASPENVLSALQKGETIHGRRVNNEVELFQWEDGETTPGLRGQLEEIGLKVSTFFFPDSSNDVVEYESIANLEVKCPDPRLDDFIDAVGRGLEFIQLEYDVHIDYAVIAERRFSKKSKEKAIAIAKFRRKEWLEWRRGASKADAQGEYPVLLWQEIPAPIFAVIYDRELIWCRRIDDHVARFFYKKKGEDIYHANKFYFLDFAAEMNTQDRATKKREKKQRRKDAAANTAAGQDGPSNPAPDSEAEAARARKVKKESARKKEQKERKKAQAAAEEQQQQYTITLTEGVDATVEMTIAEALTAQRRRRIIKALRRVPTQLEGQGSRSHGYGSLHTRPHAPAHPEGVYLPPSQSADRDGGTTGQSSSDTEPINTWNNISDTDSWHEDDYDNGSGDDDNDNDNDKRPAANQSLDLKDLETDAERALTEQSKRDQLNKGKGKSTVADHANEPDNEYDGSTPGMIMDPESLDGLRADPANTVTGDGHIIKGPREPLLRAVAEGTVRRESQPQSWNSDNASTKASDG